MEQIGQFAEGLIVSFPGDPQRGGAEDFRVLGGGEFPIVDNHQLIEHQVRHPVQLRHEDRMDVNDKSVFGLVADGSGLGALARLQRGGVEGDLAGVADAGAVFENALQLVPADARAVFLKYLRAPGGDMGAQGLPGVIGCKSF